MSLHLFAPLPAEMKFTPQEKSFRYLAVQQDSFSPHNSVETSTKYYHMDHVAAGAVEKGVGTPSSKTIE